MARAGAVVRECLELMGREVRPGVTTGELDRLAEELIRSRGRCAHLQGIPGIPGVHLRVAQRHGGSWHPRQGAFEARATSWVWTSASPWRATSLTLQPPSLSAAISDEAQDLLRVTEESLWKGIEQCEVGNRIGDISHAVQTHAEAHGYSVVEAMVGHGVGREMHEDPQVPNFGPRTSGARVA